MKPGIRDPRGNTWAPVCRTPDPATEGHPFSPLHELPHHRPAAPNTTPVERERFRHTTLAQRLKVLIKRVLNQ